MKLEDTEKRIRTVSNEWMEKARVRLDDLTKPRGSLGMLEELAARFVAIQEEIPIVMPSKEIFVFVGDHDVVAEGVSAYPQEVTSLMVRNFLAGGAGINVLARQVGARIVVVDAGIATDLKSDPLLLSRKVGFGTQNMSLGPAMTIEQAMAEPGPFLVDFMVEPEENVYPMVPPGAALTEIMEEPQKEAAVWPRRSTP